MKEFELKARVEDGPEPLRRRLDTPDRDLERKDEVIRLRRYLSAGGLERTVLAWKGPASEPHGFKLREEWETDVEDGDQAREILSRLGYSTVSQAIDRQVEVYGKQGVQVRIEEYPRMDVLVEIEGDPKIVEAHIAELGFPREVWHSWSLARFVARFEARTGEPARLHR